MNHHQSQLLYKRNQQFIPGGVVSSNRKVDPEIAFVKGQGATLWDADGNKYLDYHAAFAPYLLGHGNAEVEQAVQTAIKDGWTLTGSGTTPWEGRAAELVCETVPSVDKVQFTTTGSEATYLALRLSRAFTGKQHIILMQGGYNGWHDEVACNVMTPLEQLGPRVQKGEYPFCPLSAGMPDDIAERVHVINFNDLDSLEWVLQNFDVACLLSEPILQNIGVVKPQPEYWQRARELCTQYGALLVFDEVKTGFRHAPGGYQSICGVMPDLCVFGKAIANGYPVGAIGGRGEIMDFFIHPDASKRVLIAGTYNAHPMTMAAAIATMEKLQREANTLYPHLEALGSQMEVGLGSLFAEFGIQVTIARQGSAWCVYFMDHAPSDWHDIAEHHDMQLDLKYRNALIEQGIYQFPLAAKQSSFSTAHTSDDVEYTLAAVRKVLQHGL